jgi:hypothetical protein
MHAEAAARDFGERWTRYDSEVRQFRRDWTTRHGKKSGFLDVYKNTRLNPEYVYGMLEYIDFRRKCADKYGLDHGDAPPDPWKIEPQLLQWARQQGSSSDSGSAVPKIPPRPDRPPPEPVPSVPDYPAPPPPPPERDAPPPPVLKYSPELDKPIVGSDPGLAARLGVSNASAAARMIADGYKKASAEESSEEEERTDEESEDGDGETVSVASGVSDSGGSATSRTGRGGDPTRHRHGKKSKNRSIRRGADGALAEQFRDMTAQRDGALDAARDAAQMAAEIVEDVRPGKEDPNAELKTEVEKQKLTNELAKLEYDGAVNSAKYDANPPLWPVNAVGVNANVPDTVLDLARFGTFEFREERPWVKRLCLGLGLVWAGVKWSGKMLEMLAWTLDPSWIKVNDPDGWQVYYEYRKADLIKYCYPQVSNSTEYFRNSMGPVWVDIEDYKMTYENFITYGPVKWTAEYEPTVNRWWWVKWVLLSAPIIIAGLPWLEKVTRWAVGGKWPLVFSGEVIHSYRTVQYGHELDRRILADPEHGKDNAEGKREGDESRRDIIARVDMGRNDFRTDRNALGELRHGDMLYCTVRYRADSFVSRLTRFFVSGLWKLPGVAALAARNATAHLARRISPKAGGLADLIQVPKPEPKASTDFVKETDVKLHVSKELLVQICTPDNVQLVGEESVVRERLERYANTCSSINMFRYDVLRGRYVVQDTCLLAWGYFKMMRDERKQVPYCRTPLATAGSINVATGTARSHSLPSHP